LLVCAADVANVIGCPIRAEFYIGQNDFEESLYINRQGQAVSGIPAA
jgi:hypothetical protein